MQENPIALQSKNWLADALTELLKLKPYHTITITALASKAGLDRRTFYRHFTSKEDILLYRISQMIDEFKREILSKKDTLNAFVIAKTYFEVCSCYAEFLKILNQQGLMAHVLYAFESILPLLTEPYVTRTYDQSVDDFDYVLSFYAGGFWHLSNQWLKKGMQKTPEQLAKLVPIVMKRLNDSVGLS